MMKLQSNTDQNSYVDCAGSKLLLFRAECENIFVDSERIENKQVNKNSLVNTTWKGGSNFTQIRKQMNKQNDIANIA